MQIRLFGVDSGYGRIERIGLWRIGIMLLLITVRWEWKDRWDGEDGVVTGNFWIIYWFALWDEMSWCLLATVIVHRSGVVRWAITWVKKGCIIKLGLIILVSVLVTFGLGLILLLDRQGRSLVALRLRLVLLWERLCSALLVFLHVVDLYHSKFYAATCRRSICSISLPLKQES